MNELKWWWGLKKPTYNLRYSTNTKSRQSDMYKLSLDMKPSEVLNDIKILRNQIKDDDTYQTADVGIALSNLDDIISMCEYAINHGYE